MKNFTFLLLLFLMVSCSNDDSPKSTQIDAEIPADKKFLSQLDRFEDDLFFKYKANGKIDSVKIGTHTNYRIEYEAERVSAVYLSSTRTASNTYKFSYTPEGILNGYLILNSTTGDIEGYQPLVYNQQTNSYNDWYFMYSNGTTRKTIIDGVERTLVYNYTKKGALSNTNYGLMKYLQLIDRRAITWEAYVGLYPCEQVIYIQGPLMMENTYDSQGFISTSHMDATPDNLNATYNYIQL